MVVGDYLHEIQLKELLPTDLGLREWEPAPQSFHLLQRN